MRADAAKSTQARTALARIVVVVVVVVGVADGAATLINVLIWTEVVVVGGVDAVVSMAYMVNVHMRSDIALAYLVEDGPGTLGVDGRDLCHDLAVVVVGVIVVLARRGLLLRRADLLCTGAFGAVAVVPVLALVRLVGRATALSCLIALEAVLLVVVNSAPPEHFSKSTDSVSITGIQSVPPELSELAVGHLLGLLDLLRIELDLSRIDSVGATVALGVALLWGLQVTIVVVILGSLCGRLAASLSVLLSDSALELVDGALFELLAHYFLFAEPCILGLARFIYVSCMILSIWSLWVTL